MFSIMFRYATWTAGLFILAGCSNNLFVKTPLADVDIEKLLIGNWFVSPVDTMFYHGNAISSYTRGHEIFFVAYADPDCENEIYQAEGNWKVVNRQLIITVTHSSAPRILPAGLVVTDDILSIDEENNVLHSPDDNHLQLRTRTSSCKVETI